MKKAKLEGMTHFDLIQALIADENICDNIEVFDNYQNDDYGNSIVTMSFEGVNIGGKKGANGMLIFIFNKKGRMVSMEMATSPKGKDKWQIAASERFMDFKQRMVGVDN